MTMSKGRFAVTKRDAGDAALVKARRALGPKWGDPDATPEETMRAALAELGSPAPDVAEPDYLIGLFEGALEKAHRERGDSGRGFGHTKRSR